MLLIEVLVVLYFVQREIKVTEIEKRKLSFNYSGRKLKKIVLKLIEIRLTCVPTKNVRLCFKNRLLKDSIIIVKYKMKVI
jgi:hypothetical protein